MALCGGPLLQTYNADGQKTTIEVESSSEVALPGEILEYQIALRIGNKAFVLISSQHHRIVRFLGASRAT